MVGIPVYSTTPANNINANTGITWDEGMSPGLVNNSARQNMADLRTAFNDLIWFAYGKGDTPAYTPVYVSGTQFKIAGVDVSAIYHVGRRVKVVGSSTGTIYGSINAVSFSTDTTVTVAWDSGSLSNEVFTAVYISQIPVTGSPIERVAMLGIGMSPTNILDITQSQNAPSIISLLNASGGAAAVGQVKLLNNASSDMTLSLYGSAFTTSGLAIADAVTLAAGGSGGMAIYCRGAHPLIWGVNSAENGRVGTDGSFLWGTTTNSGVSGHAKAEFSASAGSSYALSAYQQASTTGALYVREDAGADLVDFFHSTTKVGSITDNGTSTSYNTSSDERLKNNIVDAPDAGTILDGLKVRSWDWKSDGSHQAYGFVAQEEVIVAPFAVKAGDDDPTTITKQWARDDSKLVPLLVKEIQSLRARLKAANIP